MNFHFAHQSSNPTTPAMQSVSPMCRDGAPDARPVDQVIRFEIP
jgi:hypothetical protein